jgi:hypothetical protein
MANRQWYLPPREADLITWAENFIGKVDSSKAAWGIPRAEVSPIQSALSEFKILYEQAHSPARTPVITEEKNMAKETLIRLITAMVNFRLKNPIITPAQLKDLGLTVPDGIRTPKPKPTTYPTCHIIRKGAGMLGIVYQEGTGRKGSKPPEADGARMYYGVPEVPPADQDKLPALVFATRCPHIITFREGDRGKRAYFALQWENRHGAGPWSEIQNEIIP